MTEPAVEPINHLLREAAAGGNPTGPEDRGPVQKDRGAADHVGCVILIVISVNYNDLTVLPHWNHS